jgi:uncharacterized iron-regulated protein
MRKNLSLIVLMLLPLLGHTQDKPAYLLFNEEGKRVKYEQMLKSLMEADIVFFGELHTDPIAHWLQLELTNDLHAAKKEKFLLGAEMFEADNQLILDEYMKGIYASDKFEAEMRLWGNYQTDYKPLVEFAKENEIPFIATNIPRRYASVVHKKGFEGLDELSKEALRYIAPLPIRYDPELKSYKDMLNMGTMLTPSKKVPADKKEATRELKQQAEETPSDMKVTPHAAIHSDTADKTKSETPEKMVDSDKKVSPHTMPAGHGMGMPKNTMENLPKAQAIKDATMAHFILENWTAGKSFLHFNGTYHSDNFEGIVWHLKQANPDLNIMTIATVMQAEIDSLEEENKNLANFILCVPENMTRTNR